MEETFSVRSVPGLYIEKVAVLRSEKLVPVAGDSSGTQRKGNVRRCKPLIRNGVGRLYVRCSYSDLWSMQLSETVVVICSYVL
jgi:hypothetical protein